MWLALTIFLFALGAVAIGDVALDILMGRDLSVYARGMAVLLMLIGFIEAARATFFPDNDR